MPNIKFGNIDFSGDRAYLWGAGEFSAPSRSIQKVSVHGRNGDVILDNGNYNNITGMYRVAIMENVPQNTDRLKYLLFSQKGYQRLYDSERKGFYRMANFSDGFDIVENSAGVVTVKFDCKPYCYDILGENTFEYEESGVIYNKYFEPSRPLITVYGSGSGNVYIGSQNVNISEIDDYLTIDTELQDAYKDLVNKNQNINNADIMLFPGENSISFSGGVTKVEITPRWVTL